MYRLVPARRLEPLSRHLIQQLWHFQVSHPSVRYCVVNTRTLPPSGADVIKTGALQRQSCRFYLPQVEHTTNQRIPTALPCDEIVTNLPIQTHNFPNDVTAPLVFSFVSLTKPLTARKSGCFASPNSSNRMLSLVVTTAPSLASLASAIGRSSSLQLETPSARR